MNNKSEMPLKSKISELLLDYGKMIFAGLLLGGTLTGKIPTRAILGLVIAGTAICTVVGLILAYRTTNKDKE